MSAAVAWIVSIAVAVIAGGLATVYIRSVLQRRDETGLGIAALAAMSWREFTALVLEALARRGYERAADPTPPADDGMHTLARGTDRWRLACKHGGAFVLGTAAVNAVAADIRMHNAVAGLLVTQGRIADEARGPAKLQHVELLDGAGLWPEVRDLLPTALADDIHARAQRRAHRRILLAWLAALAVGGLVLSLTLPRQNIRAPAATPPPQAVAAPARTTPAAAVVAAVAAPVAAPDPPSLDEQRRELANAVSALGIVERAIWSSTSTLEVILRDRGGDPVAMVCPVVLGYPALASSRIQFTPPPGSDQAVRFRQCRSY